MIGMASVRGVKFERQNDNLLYVDLRLCAACSFVLPVEACKLF